MTLAGTKALVVGLKKSGLASAELLVRHRLYPELDLE